MNRSRSHKSSARFTPFTMFGLRCVLPPLAAALSLLLATPVAAQDELEKPPPIAAEDAAEQPLPPKVQDEQIEPTVTIREEDDRLVEEYSYDGQVYMVKVTPKAGGVPYYYIDSDGDGNLETTPGKGMEPVRPVYWKVKEWR